MKLYVLLILDNCPKLDNNNYVPISDDISKTIYGTFAHQTNDTYKVSYSKYNLSDFSTFFEFKIRWTIEELALKLVKHVQDNYYKINEQVDDTKITITIKATNRYYVAITNEMYPHRVALDLLEKVSEANNTEIDNLFEKYQKPIEIDKIAQVQNELDTTKMIILESLEKIISRGEDMDQLVEKCESLAESSKLLLDDAKKLNSCCKLF
jgi:hypothetical protein